MPKPKLSDLALFQEWLIESYSITPKSASVYASRVRKILNTIENINDVELKNFVDSVNHTSSLYLFLSAWKRFAEFLKENNNINIPLMERPKKTKRSVKIEAHSSMLELAYYLKVTLSIPYTKMLTFTWANVKCVPGSSWEILDPVEHGTYYRVPDSLLKDVANFIFGDYPINPGTPIFLGNVAKNRKLSRTMLSNALQDFSPSFSVTYNPPIKVSTTISTPEPRFEPVEDEMIIAGEEELDVPDILNDYAMFDPDKI